MASLLAQNFSASLDGLHVVASAADWDARLEKVRRLITEHNAREQLAVLLAPFAASVEVESFVARGAASQAIVSHAALHGADLIVLGGSSTARADGSAQRVIPSVAAQADCAVLSVPGDSSACAMRRMLLAVGAGTDAMAATAWAATLARRFDAVVRVVRVSPASRGFWSTLWAVKPAAASSRDTALAASVERALHSLRFAQVAALEHPEAELSSFQVAELAAADGYDLVVVGLPAELDRACAEAELVAKLRRDCLVPTLSIRTHVGGLLAQRGRRQFAREPYADVRASA